MEARRVHPFAMGLATIVALVIWSEGYAQTGPQSQHVAHSQNFIVFAASPQLAAKVSQAAESYRSQLATYWLDKELPAWSQRCPIHVVTSPKLGAGGETRFSLMTGAAGNWMMSVQGTEQRVLDSVLPHEITHTIFATHFAPFDKYVPRWADEGACTTVEHADEKGKHEHFLQEFLRTGRGISFNKMFSLKDYPKDILPLYAQGHSVVQFLLDQGGPRKFVAFLEDGMRSDAWQAAMTRHYKYETIGELQMLWNKWLKDGSPKSLAAYAPSLQGTQQNPIALASATPAAHVEMDSKVQLASNRRERAESIPPALRNASYASGPSWYRQQLRAVSGGPSQTTDAGGQSVTVTEAPTGGGALDVASVSSSRTYPLHAYQASLQAPAQPQRNSVQVVDWGKSQAVPGIASQPQMVPLMR